jgi:hypothetical protein
MTTEKQELAAGRELDSLVAEKVMGWTQSDDTRGSGFTVKDGNGKGLGWWRFDQPRLGDAQPHFSTSIADAWLVVEKMRETGWVYCIVQSYPENAEEPSWDDSTMRVRWWVEFSRYRSPIEVTSPECESPALAICLAALKAVL